jgi:hypothetical protein
MLLIPEGYAQASFRFALNADPEEMFVTCGFALAGSTPTILANDCADAMWAALNGGAACCDQYTFRGVRLRVGPGPPYALTEAPRNLVGTWSVAPLPQNVAILVRKNTASAGREHRGRMYFPPILAGEGDVSANGMISSVLQAGIAPFMAALFANLDPVILHDAAQLGGAPAPTPITQFVLDQRVATQRRRLR